MVGGANRLPSETEAGHDDAPEKRPKTTEETDHELVSSTLFSKQRSSSLIFIKTTANLGHKFFIIELVRA